MSPSTSWRGSTTWSRHRSGQRWSSRTASRRELPVRRELPPRLARALRELGEPVRHVVDVPELGKGATDAEIIPFAAAWDYRLVSRDKAMLKPSQLKTVIHAEEVGYYLFRLGKARQPAKWELIQYVIKHWPAIVEHASETPPPYVMQIRRTGGLKPYP